MRELGKVSSSGGKNKSERLKNAAKQYLKKSKSLLKKTQEALMYDFKREEELLLLIDLEYYNKMLTKHIDLLERLIF